MTDEQIRLECLKLARELSSAHDDLFDLAERIWAFVSRNPLSAQDEAGRSPRTAARHSA